MSHEQVIPFPHLIRSAHQFQTTSGTVLYLNFTIIGRRSRSWQEMSSAAARMADGGIARAENKYYRKIKTEI